MHRRVELDVVNLADAFNQPPYIFTEFPLQIIAGQACVFQRVMQNCGNDAAVVQMNIRQQLRHFQRVRYILAAADPGLPLVGFAPDQKCFFYFPNFILAQILQGFAKFFELSFFLRTSEVL